MKILSINNQNKINSCPNFKANLWVDQSVKEVIKGNEKAFLAAAEKCDEWLQTERSHIPLTLTIRKNTNIIPKVAFEHQIRKISYAYPYEIAGCAYYEKVKEYENLEFELNNRKCGFWFNKLSNADKLFSDFQNVFNSLNQK